MGGGDFQVARVQSSGSTHGGPTMHGWAAVQLSYSHVQESFSSSARALPATHTACRAGRLDGLHDHANTFGLNHCELGSTSNNCVTFRKGG